jgi:hypothetical protein
MQVYLQLRILRNYTTYRLGCAQHAVLSLAKVWLGSHNRAFKLIKVIHISNNIINDGVMLRLNLSKP